MSPTSKPARFHDHLLLDLRESLNEILSPSFGGSPERWLQHHFKLRRRWGAKDRKFFAEAIYESLRWKRRNEFIAGESAAADPLKLWMAGEIFSGRAVPSELRSTGEKFEGFHEVVRSRLASLSGEPRAIRQSIPDWLEKLGQESFEARWDAVLASLNTQAPVDLRVNRLKAPSLERVQSSLLHEGVVTEVIPNVQWGISLLHRKSLAGTQVMKEAWVEPQDRSSQRVTEILDPKPGERILDACAGSGGKTLHIAAQMNNRGQILAVDIQDKKLERLRERANFAGAGIIETWQASQKLALNDFPEKWLGSFDRVLVDAPCSSLGTLRRRPDLKWSMSPARIEEIVQYQQGILQLYSHFVRPGGILVYSTCSVLSMENEKQTRKFLMSNPDFSLNFEQDLGLKEALKNAPSYEVDPALLELAGDGFFVAHFSRKV